jgi:hypothetical protein
MAREGFIDASSSDFSETPCKPYIRCQAPHDEQNYGGRERFFIYYSAQSRQDSYETSITEVTQDIRGRYPRQPSAAEGDPAKASL